MAPNYDDVTDEEEEEEEDEEEEEEEVQTSKKRTKKWKVRFLIVLRFIVDCLTALGRNLTNFSNFCR